MDFLTIKRRSGALKTQFWMASGISYSDVLAAYQFKGVNTQSEAISDLSGHGRTLSNTGCTWSTGNGFYVPMNSYLDHSTLRSSGSIKSIVMKISGAGFGGGATPLSGNWGGIGIWLSTPFCTQSYWYEVSGRFGVTHGNGSSVNNGGSLARTSVETDGAITSGVIGFTLSGEVAYLNGSAISKSIATDPHNNHGEWSAYICQVVPRLVGGYNDGSGSGWASLSHVTFGGYFYVQYMAIYSKNLSASEHAGVASLMNSMG